MEKKMSETVTGYIDHVIFRNEDNGYTVMVLKGMEEEQELTCVGTFPAITQGAAIEASGNYTTHPVYGKQFQISSYVEKMPEDALAMERYLGSGAIKGIGPKTAAALVTSIDISAFRGHDELASYCGVAPSDRRSGSSIRSTSPQHGGNRRLKNLLIFSCNSLIGTDNRFGRYYGECRARGMRHSKALKAVARKRLKVIYAIMRDAVPYAA